MESKSKKIIFIIIAIFLLIGAGLYFWLYRGGGETEFGPSVKAPSPIAVGCGNNLCEEGETFSSCSTDCYNPGSSGPELAKLALVPSDFPPPYQGTIPEQKTSWGKLIDELIDESSVFPLLKGRGALAIHETIIRLSAPFDRGDLSWDQWGRLEQYILVFPPDKISGVFEAMNLENLSKLDSRGELSFQELPDPKVGEKSKAFKMHSRDGRYLRYVIVFVKNNLLEFLVFSGEKYEYQVFPPLARKAAEKIK